MLSQYHQIADLIVNCKQTYNSIYPILGICKAILFL